jgi:hypothetical protein
MTTTLKTKAERPTLEEAQKLVGGYVELVKIPSRPDIQLFVDEDGLMKNLPPNEDATRLAGIPIVGPALVLEGEARWD